MTGQVGAFVRSRSTRPRWDAVPENLRPATRAEGYRLQRDVHEALSRQGARLVGYKIGCTAPESRRPFGLDEPIYAGIFEHTQAATLGQGLAVPLVEPSIECEIALRVAASPDVDETGDIPEERLIDFVAEACVACEIIDSRYGQPPSEVGVPTLLADDFLHAGFVLGAPRTDVTEKSLRDFRAVVRVDDKVFTDLVSGTLPPLTALRWLVKKLAENGDRLRAGQVVLTGSLLRPVPVAGASAVSMSVEGFGALET